MQSVMVKSEIWDFSESSRSPAAHSNFRKARNNSPPASRRSATPTSSSTRCVCWTRRSSKPLINQDAGVQRFRFFNRREKTEKLVVVSTARSQACGFRLAQLTAQDEVEKIVIVGGGFEGKFARVCRRLTIFRAKAREQVKDVVSREPRSFTAEEDRHAQLKESQAVFSNYAPQLLGRFAVERRLRVDQNAKQSWLVFLVQR